jgi:uncharacterized protein (DUF924 family)
MGYAGRMTQNALPSPADVVNFWIEAGPSKWFSKDDAFDKAFKDRFLEAHYAAARRDLDLWMETAHGALALLILLDQFPRNAFRDTGHMFATDSLALHFTRIAVAQGYHQAVDLPLQPFILMPLMHSESLEDQEELLRILSQDTHPDTYKYAVIHRDVIRDFGRFPHRNQSLGRATTEAEQAFLDSGGFSG